jgi:outer membrane receptor for ferric coprogen and ferric-rhodotorulic acid
MRIDRATVVACSILTICLAGGAFALAQETGHPGSDDEKAQSDDEKAQSDDEKAQSDDEPSTTETEPEEPKSVLQETVTVTATRVETDLMKTPIAVTVIDQETMDREGVRNVRDIAQMVPNMDIATVNGQSTPIISLRGIRSTNTTELGDPSVGVHLDGIYSPRMQGILGLMFDNERVEVLRGPQGTLFGRNSTVGSINIIPAKPKPVPTAVRQLQRCRSAGDGQRAAVRHVGGPLRRPLPRARLLHRRLLGPEPVRPAAGRAAARRTEADRERGRVPFSGLLHPHAEEQLVGGLQ